MISKTITSVNALKAIYKKVRNSTEFESASHLIIQHLQYITFACNIYILFLDKTSKFVQFLAIDVDDGLITTAKDKLLDDNTDYFTKNSIHFSTLNLMDIDNVNKVFKEYLNRFQKEQFDLMFCFSVTMWIHLNHGDDGLELFFKTAKKWCKYLVLEPQPWKCYKTASRRMRRANQPDFEYLNKIKYQCDKLLPYITNMCVNSGFAVKQVFGETGWKRPIILFESVI